MPNDKITISLLPNDQELIYFLEKKKKTQSLSAYVRELIRNDMKSNKEIPNFEQIYEYVERRLQERGIAMKDNSEKNVEEKIDEADKDLIMNLF